MTLPGDKWPKRTGQLHLLYIFPFLYREPFEFAKCFTGICPLAPILPQILTLAGIKAKLIDAAIQSKLIQQLPEDGTAGELY
jgi:hypothetical protein